MLSPCERCQFSAQTRHHSTDIGCAVAPDYWQLWHLLSNRNNIATHKVDSCTDFREREDLQPRTLELTLTQRQWQTVLQQSPSELREQIRSQLGLEPEQEIVMHPVDSTCITAIGYNRLSSTLLIDFYNSRYSYANVPSDVFEEFMEAPSKGTYLNEDFKPIGYSYTQIY